MPSQPIASYLTDGTLMEEHQSLPSTNDYIRQLTKEGRVLPERTIVWAHEQTQGRGRGQNRWLSEKGKNISLSYYMQGPGIEAERQFDLARATGLSIIKLLSKHGIGALIKWPNDIYVGRKKIAGMLIENGISGQELKYSIIGIGLNVNQTQFPISGASSIRLETGKETPVRKLITDLHHHLAHHLAMAREQPGTLHRLFDDQLMGKDKIVHYIKDEAQQSAHLQGTDNYGRILLQSLDGQLHSYGMDGVKIIIR